MVAGAGMLWTVSVLAAALLVLLLLAFLLALVTPMRLCLVAGTAPTWHLRIGLRPFNRLAPCITLHDSARQRPAERVKAAAGDRTVGPFSRRTLTRLWRGARAAPQLLKALWRPLRLERLTMRGDFGFPDPSDTGRFYGWLLAAQAAGRADSERAIDLRPDFSGPRADGSVDAVICFVPLAFVLPVLRFVWRVFGARR